MSDVILIYPRTLWDIKNVTTRLPLAVLYTGTVLKANGFSVQIIDQRVEDQWPDILRAALRERPLWVGLSSMTGRQIKWGLAAAQIVRGVNPTIPLVWGGVHPTILPEQTLAHPLVDMVVVGEGEMTALELSQALRSSQQANLAPEQAMMLPVIAGLAWPRSGKMVYNAPRSFIPMDDLPPLDYSLVNVENYVLAEVPGERSLQITTSRGCPMKCGYCYLTVVPDGRRYRAESPERTVAHMERVMRQFNLNAIHIIDDEFFTQIKRVRRVCELIIEHGLQLILRTNCRIDYIDRMDMRDLHLFRRAGFKHFYLGVESGSDRVLGLINKGITHEQVIRVNRKLQEAGISPKFSFMGGFPTETVAEVRDTMRLMVELVGENPDAYTTPVQLYSPYPGTALFDLCQHSGMDKPQTLESWTESGWEHIDYSWLTPQEERFLQKTAYFTFFLDGKTVSESIRSPLLRWLAHIYGWIIRQRIKLNFFAFMPEVRLIKWTLAHAK